MNDLRILLVESDPRRADELNALLTTANHLSIPVSSFEEATEALFLQKFDLVLLGPSSDPQQMAVFIDELREFEGRQNAASRTAVLSYAPDANCAALDGVLAPSFDPNSLADAVLQLRRAPPDLGNVPGSSHLLVFDPAGFQEQCADEADLMVEIIDLFQKERAQQLASMGEALAIGDFALLQRVAHTVKGSLGALHAPRARQRAEELEMAARAGDPALCLAELESLEQDLDELAQRLAAFRDSHSGA